MAGKRIYPLAGKPARVAAARGGKLYPYFDANGVEQRAKLKDLPPLVRDIFIEQARKRLAKYHKKRREREARARTLRAEK